MFKGDGVRRWKICVCCLVYAIMTSLTGVRKEYLLALLPECAML